MQNTLEVQVEESKTSIKKLKLYFNQRMEIYSFLDANFQLTKASVMSQKERKNINDYFKANKSDARSLKMFFPSNKALSFPNSVYFNHLLSFTDHINLQITPAICKTMFKAYLKTLNYEK